MQLERHAGLATVVRYQYLLHGQSVRCFQTERQKNGPRRQ